MISERYATLAFLFVFIGIIGSGFAGDSTYYDAINSLIDLSNPVGTQWHELYPNYCTGPYTITYWGDNGDGVLSPCDTIGLTDQSEQTTCQHVVEVTVTIQVSPAANPQDLHYWDSEGGYDTYYDVLEQPVCTYWHEVYPEFCLGPYHIVGWDDNGDGILSECDNIAIADYGTWHVDDVSTDIITEPTEGCAVDVSTWGRIKALFH